MIAGRRLALAVVVAAAAATLRLVLSQGEERHPRGAAAETLVIVSPHWEGIRHEFGDAFEELMAERGHPVEVAWLDPGGTSACLRFVRTRFERMPAGIGVDLFFGGGVEPYLELAERGLLDPVVLAPATVAALPRPQAGITFFDTRTGWYGACLTTFGIVFNRAVLARMSIPLPASFRDLGSPAARTWVGVADPRESGTVHMIYELILQGRGWDEGFRLLTRIAANARQIREKASEVSLEVGAGQIAMGLTLDSYAWAQVDRLGADSIGFVAPDEETVVNPDAIAVLRGSPHRDLATAFVEFVLSPRGQALWMLAPGTRGGPRRYYLARLPIRPDVYRDRSEWASAGYDPFAGLRPLAYDPDLGAQRWTILNDLVGTVLVDLHRDLAAAWKEVVAAGRPAPAEEMLTRPPLTGQEALDLARRTDRDASERQRRLARWSREASARYRQACRLARTGDTGTPR